MDQPMIKLTNQQKEDIDAIAWHFGDERAVLHAAEEYAEAAAALTQYFRARYQEDGLVPKRFESACEEIADAFVMLHELLEVCPDMVDHIKSMVDYKINRTFERYSIQDPTNGEG